MARLQQHSWSSAARSHVGTVRKLNEDACLSVPETGLWVVADGMGGHSAGDVASNAIVESLGDIKAPSSLSGLVGEVHKRLQRVNRVLRAAAKERGKGIIGSTVVVLTGFGAHGAVIWAGDSRIYRLRGDELTC